MPFFSLNIIFTAAGINYDSVKLLIKNIIFNFKD
tara:strand:- start:408 stop:509 length:102 start_codon:yes stop_codon:yes gene_type:complete